MAIPKSTKNEMASNVLISLNDLIVFSKVKNLVAKIHHDSRMSHFYEYFITDCLVLARQRFIKSRVGPILFITEMPPFCSYGLETKLSHPIDQ